MAWLEPVDLEPKFAAASSPLKKGVSSTVTLKLLSPSFLPCSYVPMALTPGRSFKIKILRCKSLVSI